MKLQAYLTGNGISHAQFAEMLGGVSEFGVRKWARGERTPRPGAIRRIHEVTAGQVAAGDFFPNEVAA